MAIEAKCFLTKDNFIDNNQNIISSLLELSSISATFAKDKKVYYSLLDPTYSLYVFKLNNSTDLTQMQVNNAINVISKFNVYIDSTTMTTKQQFIINFMVNYNSANPSNPVTNLDYLTIDTVRGYKYPSYINFTISGVDFQIWLKDTLFQTLYPEYEIDIVTPFPEFRLFVNNPAKMISALDSFDYIVFNNNMDLARNKLPPTHITMLNIPYKVPNTTIYKNCYFGFLIYGEQGNYNYILQLALYDYLKNVVGLDDATIISLFPTILNINEFFITPRWDNLAIPSNVGQNGIYSQVIKAYTNFDINKFIKVYTDGNFISNNTYMVPFDYNNILLMVTNGLYTDSSIKDFKTVYKDILTVNSLSPDFARMRQETQKLVTVFNKMLAVCDAEIRNDFLLKITYEQEYKFNTVRRSNVEYLSYFFRPYQIYMIPKYEFLRLV